VSRTQPSGLKQRAAAASVVVKRSLETLLSDANMLDVIAAMTLLLLLLHTEPEKYLRVPVTVLSTAGLLYRPLARKASFWFVVTAVLAAGHFTLWHLIDNHKYLMTYWCLALACSLLMEDPRQALAFNARLLTGLCFFFAVLWKATSPDFLDGSFSTSRSWRIPASSTSRKSSAECRRLSGPQTKRPSRVSPGSTLFKRPCSSRMRRESSRSLGS
jgi:hypothetical protein